MPRRTNPFPGGFKSLPFPPPPPPPGQPPPVVQWHRISLFGLASLHTHGQPRKGFPFLTRVAGLWSTSASPCFVPVRMSEAELYSECPASTHEFLGDSVVQRKKEARHAEDGPLFWGTWGTPSKSPESMISPKLSLASTRWVLRKVWTHGGVCNNYVQMGFPRAVRGVEKVRYKNWLGQKRERSQILGQLFLFGPVQLQGNKCFATGLENLGRSFAKRGN